MKYIKFFLVFTASVLGSCVSFDYFESSSWAWDRGNARGTVQVISVSAEKAGDWGALEKEINDLLPLLFSEEAYLVVSPSARADYSAEVSVREREFPDGWQTKRSLSAEVRLWRGESFPGQVLPLASGRALNQGKQSFASSVTLSAMLRKAVKNAVRGLEKKI